MMGKFRTGLVSAALAAGVIAAPVAASAAPNGHSWTGRPAGHSWTAIPQGHSWTARPTQHPTRTGWVTDKAGLAREGVHDLNAAQFAALACGSHSTWNGTRIIPASFAPYPADLPWNLCDSGGGKLVMQYDRNLVYYDKHGGARAASNTYCDPNASYCNYYRLHLQNDANIVVADDSAGSYPLWDSHTCCIYDSPGSTHHDIAPRYDYPGTHGVLSSVRVNSTNQNIGSKWFPIPPWGWGD